MKTNRLFTGALVAIVAVLSSACGSGETTATVTETATVTAAAPSNETSVSSAPTAVPLYQATTPYGDVEKAENDLLRCKAGLTPIVLPSSGNGVDIGQTRVTIDQVTDTTSSDPEFWTRTTTFIFHGAAPEVKGVYVATYWMSDEDPTVSTNTDYSAVWKPGMEKSFSVNEEDFGFMNSILSVVLCAAP